MHVVSNDKLWKCRNMAFLVAIGFWVLYRDNGFCVTTGLGLGKGFFSRDRIFFVTTEDRQDRRVLCCNIRFYVAKGVGRCRKAHCRYKELHVAIELCHGRRFPCHNQIF